MSQKPETVATKDDGTFPNSRYPALVYFGGIGKAKPAGDLASTIEDTFARNGWTGSWRNGLYTFHHYHSTAHEVLGIYGGQVRVQLGGPRGPEVTLAAGDVVVIPAGVAHKNLGASGDFRVVGAYPRGTSPDLMRGAPGERPGTDANIKRLGVPPADPLAGAAGALVALWGRIAR